MREIKFRVWSKKEKKMYYGDRQHEPNMIGFDGKIFATGSTGVMCNYGCSADYVNLCNPEDYELMEYTGINKDGKEIYEGDILCIDDPNYSKKFHGEVIYDSKYGAFFVKGKDLCAILRWHVPIKYVEILGNKWENPELLELLKEEF